MVGERCQDLENRIEAAGFGEKAGKWVKMRGLGKGEAAKILWREANNSYGKCDIIEV